MDRNPVKKAPCREAPGSIANTGCNAENAWPHSPPAQTQATP